MRGVSTSAIDACISKVEQLHGMRINHSPFDRRLFRICRDIPIQDTREAILLQGCLIVVRDLDLIDFCIPLTRTCFVFERSML